MEVLEKDFKENYNKNTMQELADMYGVSKPTIYATAKKLGLKKGSGRLYKLKIAK